ncbi:hypothetical protein DFH11DRAFT_1753165 [Phellopilus nigrolimitatus]|nr:hypothetical protein DFH11DRAFT_1753165 [Phellopilus nigrolimitatus]
MLCTTPRPARSARSSRSSRSLRATTPSRSSSVWDRGSTSTGTGARARPSLPSEREMALARAWLWCVAAGARDGRAGGRVWGHSARRGAGLRRHNRARHRGGYNLAPALLDAEAVDELGVLRDGGGGGGGGDGRFFGEDADGSEDSDSDIDLHTPLPHILLRAGVLSPHSKVLASAALMASLASSASRGSLASMGLGGGGRESIASNVTVASMGSVMTKSGLFKDERDTDRRRKRHRDGKQLREGLGLTTGLGWSDMSLRCRRCRTYINSFM